MKKLISLFTIALFLCISINSYAQVVNYAFTQSPGIYIPITGGTVVATATSNIGPGSLDDNIYTLPSGTIPFTFTYDGVGYTGFNLSSNGFITFGATSPSDINYGPISNTGTYAGAISAFGGDNNSLFNISGFTGEIRYQTIGSEFIIQYSNFRPLSTSTSTTVYWRWNFQIRLNSNGEIKFVYDANFVGAPPAPASRQVGLRGPDNTFATNVKNRMVTVAPDTWAASHAGIFNTSACASSTILLPVSGQTYTFTPPPACNMIIANLNPRDTITPGCNPITIAPKVNISNMGTSAQTAITVTYAVPGASYSETVAAPDLASWANQDVNFPNTLVINSAFPGVKDVTITVNSICSVPQTYTLNSSYTVSTANVNFGGGAPPANCNYFWANSTAGASCAPNQPIFYWEDTTGSTYLTVNGIATTPLTIGDLDDGAWLISPAFASGNRIQYCGVCYTQLVIGTNGIIGLGSRLSGMNAITTLSLPNVSAARPAIFPLWYDLYWGGNVAVVTKNLGYKISGQKLIITYSNAPSSLPADANDYVSFQVILDIAIACGSGDGTIICQYDPSRSGSTFLSKYFANTLTMSVGIQDADGTLGIQYRRSTPAVTVAGPLFSSPVAVAYGPNQNILPVELSSFTSSVNGNNVNLYWATTTETNNSGFNIERSDVRGQTSNVWTKIGNVAGNGTTTRGNNYSFTDRNLASGKYNYRLKQIDFNGNYIYYNLGNEVNVGIPEKYDLSQNYPNPFNPSTKVNYDIPFDGKVSLKIFNISGREVATIVDEVKTAGYYTVNFNATNLTSGVYFYRISSGNFVSTKKMTFVK